MSRLMVVQTNPGFVQRLSSPNYFGDMNDLRVPLVPLQTTNQEPLVLSRSDFSGFDLTCQSN